MIRFSAVLVAAAIGVLIGGVVTSKLLLVYVAIGLSAAALLALAIGVVLKRAELFGAQVQAPAPVGQPFIQQNGTADTPAPRVPAAASAAFGEAASGQPPRADSTGQDRAGQPAFGQPGYGQQPFPPFGVPRTDVQSAASAPADTDVPAVARPAGPDAPPGRFGASFRGDSPWSSPAPAAASAAPTPAVPADPSAPAVPPWRERPSPSYGDALGSSPAVSSPGRSWADVASTRVEPILSPPDRSSAPSWFDRPSWPSHDDDETAGPRKTAEESAESKPATAAGSASGSEGWAWTRLASPPGGSSPSGTADASDEDAEDDDWRPSRSWLDDNDDEPDTSSTAASAPVKADDDAELPGDSATPEDATEEPASSDVESDWPASGRHEADDSAASDPDAAGPGRRAAAESEDPEALASDKPADPGSPSSSSRTRAEADDADEPPAQASGSGAKQVTVIPGVPRYHDENCILIRFMTDEDVQRMTIQEATKAGCTPCRACQPDSD